MGHCGRRFRHGHPWWARRVPHTEGRRCPARLHPHPQPLVDLKDLPQTRKDERHPHELVLNPTPYGHGQYICDGCQLAGEGASYHCAQCQFDLHLDCQKARENVNPWQRRQQWFRLHQEAMKAMELNTREGFEKARELLKEQVAASPFHRVTPLYNLACVEARLGDNLEKALEYLQEAVAAGWNDVQHIKNDADLNNLHELDGYQALIASLEADSSDDEAIVDIDIRGLSQEERKKVKAEWKQKRKEMKQEKFAERLQAKAEKFQALAEKFQAKAEKFIAEKKAAEEKAAEKKAEEKNEKPVELEKQAEPVVETAPAPASAPAPSPAPVPAPVQMSGSSSIEDFQGKLKTLEEMGFMDRRRNITALIVSRGDMVAAVQSLLSGQ